MSARTASDRICSQMATAPFRRPASEPQTLPAGVAPSRRSGRRISTLLMMTCLTWSEMSLLQQDEARAEAGAASVSGQSRDPKLSAVKAEANIQAARHAVATRPNDAVPVQNLVDALTRAGRDGDALAEANRFIARGTPTAALKAQRGYLRREMGDLAGAADDFTAALAGSELSADQRGNVESGLADVQAAQAQAQLDHAQSDLARGDLAPAAAEAGLILQNDPSSEAAMLIRVEALAAAGRKPEALAAADQFVQRAGTNPLLRAQRGFLRRELDDPHGAADDFAAAMAGDGLSSDQRLNVQAGLAEAQTAQAQADLDRADAALKRSDYQAALAASLKALERDPRSEAAMRMRIEALLGMGRNRDAATEADIFIGRNAASATLFAQRGFIRRELHDTAGAIEDFTAALAGDELSVEQRRNVQAGLAEAQAAARTPARGGVNSGAGAVALNGARKGDAQQEADRLIARGHAQGWVYVQRGIARADSGDFRGAVADFDVALSRGDLDRQAVPNIRYARAEAAAMLADGEGKPLEAEASYRDYLQTDPTRADGWFRLGYLLLKQGRRQEAAEALQRGIALRPVGAAYLDAATASIFTNAPLASKLYREGLDRRYAGDPSLSGQPEADLERIKNEVVEADASIRTSIGAGTILGRPEAAGGINNALGAETSMRFDGRYLPEVLGLEAFVRGLTDKDANGVRETDTAAGLRYRPIRDVNLYFGGSVDHFYQPNSITELVLNWGLGLGADPYPYATGWKPYWDFSTIGAWRTLEERVLEDVRGNVGFLYEFHSPFRAAIGPTILAVAGYDNKATIPLAAGIGPSVLANFWLGGDKYRSYDAVFSVQVGYLFNIGPDERQRGWRGQVGVTF
jgi:cellulose synthase operon protein C